MLIFAFYVPYVEKFLNWNLQVQVLEQDEGEVLQDQQNQEIQVICNLPTYILFIFIFIFFQESYCGYFVYFNLLKSNDTMNIFLYTI